MNIRRIGKGIAALLALVVLTAGALTLVSCFSPLTGTETQGRFVIGGSSARAYFDNTSGADIAQLTLDITVSDGPGPEQRKTGSGGEGVPFTVNPGTWTITVRAYFNDNFAAYGSMTVNIAAGDNIVEIKLHTIEAGLYRVDGGTYTRVDAVAGNNVAAAVGHINTPGNAGTYMLFAQSSTALSTSPQTLSAGGYLTLMGITGRGVTASTTIQLGGDGTLFTVENGASLTLNDNITLSGATNSAVCVDSGGTFTMIGGTISGNTSTQNGGGVYVDVGGTFSKTGGEISGNTAAQGSAVYVNSTPPKYRNTTAGEEINLDSSTNLNWESPPPPKVLTGISVTTPPTKTSYTLGETLDLTGLVITAMYDDSSTNAVTVYTTTPAALTVLTAADTSVGVSYTENGVTKTTTFDITVNPVTTYTVTFNANGGMSTDTSPKTVVAGNSVLLPLVTKTGSIFGGWYDNDTFTGTALNSPYTPVGDITLYAKWAFTVSFNANGATGGNPSLMNVDEGTSITLPAVTKADNTFDGWYENAGFTGAAVISPYTPTETVTLYAKWNPVSYEVGDPGPGGGIVFYKSALPFYIIVDGVQKAVYYLEVAPNDVTSLLTWATSGNAEISVATGTNIGTGYANTAAILDTLPTEADAPAAFACKNYSGGGKTDWFLPNRDELQKLYEQRNLAELIGTWGTSGDAQYYWSSSQEDAAGFATQQNFTDGAVYTSGKNGQGSVRPIRAF